MKLWSISQAIVLWGFLAVPTQPALAQETDREKSGEWAEEGRHKIGLFLGITAIEGDAGPSVGLDYEYRISRRFGIGGVVEFTGGDFREGIAGVPLYWHPWRELTLVAAPGVEIQPAERESEFLVRAGADYGFALQRGFEIAPGVYLDFTSEDVALVVGAAVAKSL